MAECLESVRPPGAFIRVSATLQVFQAHGMLRISRINRAAIFYRADSDSTASGTSAAIRRLQLKPTSSLLRLPGEAAALRCRFRAAVALRQCTAAPDSEVPDSGWMARITCQWEWPRGRRHGLLRKKPLMDGGSEGHAGENERRQGQPRRHEPHCGRLTEEHDGAARSVMQRRAGSRFRYRRRRQGRPIRDSSETHPSM